jgi:diaphanous 2
VYARVCFYVSVLFLNVNFQTFAKDARLQYEIMDNMFKNMESLYTDLSEFYAFDKQKYSLEEFFTDVKTFKDAFLVSLILGVCILLLM